MMIIHNRDKSALERECTEILVKSKDITIKDITCKAFKCIKELS